MKDAEYEEQKARVQTLIDRWMGPLGLKWWDIVIDWSGERGAEKDGGQRSVAMNCSTRWEYLQARITIYLPTLAEVESDEELERHVVHEFMHVFLAEGRWNDDDSDDSAKHEERVASQLAKAFIWVRDFTAKGEAPAIKVVD